MVFRNQELFLRSSHIAMYTSSIHSVIFLPSLMVDANAVFENTAVRNSLLLILYGPVYVYLCRFREWQIPLQNGCPHSPLYQKSMSGSCHHKYLALTSFLTFAKWINVLRELLFWLAFLWLQINLSISSYAWWLLRFFSGKLLLHNNPLAFFPLRFLYFSCWYTGF